MRIMPTMAGLAAALLAATPAAAQQGAKPFDAAQVEFEAERTAGVAMVSAGERYLMENVMGFESKTCRFITEGIEHLVRAGIAIRALPPGANPDMLTSAQRKTFNEKVGVISERNAALKKKACARP